MAEDEGRPTRLARTTIYENHWVNLYVDRVQFPDGRLIEQHHLLDFERQAVVAVVENAAAQILLVQAYRYATNSLDWELPAGGIEKAESVTEAAQREVLEESGFETTEPRLVYTFHTMSGISNHVTHVVRCKAGRDTGVFDKNEIKSIQWATEAEIRQMFAAQIFKDGISLVGLLLYLNKLV